MKLVFLILLFLISLFIFSKSIDFSKKNGFYKDAFGLFPLGIYVWGDGLILAPFWMLVSLIFYFLSAIQIMRFFLIFYLVRSFYEVIYWLVHQSSSKDYQPPFFRNVDFLGAQESAILYQLWHSVLIVLLIMGLIWTY